MSNFKLKRTAEHPNETTTGIISLSEHIADPDAHRLLRLCADLVQSGQ